MGTITKRPRKDGSTGYTAQIRIKRKGVIVHTEAETFDREAAAVTWMKRRESALSEPGALEKLKQHDPALRDVIDQYIKESVRELGKTKSQVLEVIKGAPIAAQACSQITSADVVSFARSLDCQPQTRGNYISHLATIFRVARPAWGYPLNSQAMEDARVVMLRLGLIGRSRERTRRPTRDEMDQLLEHFASSRSPRKDSIDMVGMALFSMFSSRRQEEVTRVVWEDLQLQRDTDGRVIRGRLLVRHMKHPGEKIGNDVLTDLPDVALALIVARMEALPADQRRGRIFPYNAESVSRRWTDTCALLGIEDLHYHDLRHEAISRLFEMGWNIPQVARVSGHRTWNSLKRYTHLDECGDKWRGWPWLSRVGVLVDQPDAANR